MKKRTTSAVPTATTRRTAGPTPVLLCAASVVLAAGAYAACAVRFAGAAPTAAAHVVLGIAGAFGAIVAWRRDDRVTLIAIVAAGLLARAFLVPLDPVYSNDVYRYLWDGRDLIRGIDPYVVLPSAPELASSRAGDWLFPHIDWADVPTLYPPLDLALYALAARIDAQHLFAIKGILLLGDLATVAVLASGLRRAGLPLGRLAIYAWNPVVLTEFAGGGHEEAWAVFCIVAALVALRAERPTTSALALAAGVLTKLYPLAFVPVFFAARRTWHAAAIALATVLVAYLPFVLWIAGAQNAGEASDTLGFLRAFAYGYRFNDSLHEVIGTDGAALVFGGVVAVAIVARLRGARLAALVFILELAYLACSPNVYPWYTAIFPALAPLVPYALRGSWRPLTLGTLLWSALTPLAYLDRRVLDQGSLGDVLVHVVEYLPLYAGIAACLVHVVKHDRVRTAATVRAALRSLRPRRPLQPVGPPVPRPPAARIDLRLDALPNRPELRDAAHAPAAVPQVPE